MTTGSAAFTTTHRVIMRVHDDTTVVRAASEPAVATGLTERFQIMVGVGDGTDGSAAGDGDHAGLTGRETQDRIVAFTGGELGEGAGGTGHRGALSGTKLDGVDQGTHRNGGKREAVAHIRSGIGAGLEHLTDLQAVRGEDIALQAVLILDEGDAGGCGRSR